MVRTLPVERQEQAAKVIDENHFTDVQTRAYVESVLKNPQSAVTPEPQPINSVEKAFADILRGDGSDANAVGESDLAATQEVVAAKVRVEEAKVSALKKHLSEFYPTELVNLAVDRLGRCSEKDFAERFKNLISFSWSRITAEEQVILLEYAGLN